MGNRAREDHGRVGGGRQQQRGHTPKASLRYVEDVFPALRLDTDLISVLHSSASGVLSTSLIGLL